MILEEILKIENIELDLKATERTEAINYLIDLLYKSKEISNKEEVVKAALKREEEFTTGVGLQVAIPHAKSPYVNTPSIAVGISKEGIEWPTEDGQNPRIIFLIVVPEEASDLHLRLLAEIARKIIHDEVRKNILESINEQGIINALKLEPER